MFSVSPSGRVSHARHVWRGAMVQDVFCRGDRKIPVGSAGRQEESAMKMAFVAHSPTFSGLQDSCCGYTPVVDYYIDLISPSGHIAPPRRDSSPHGTPRTHPMRHLRGAFAVAFAPCSHHRSLFSRRCVTILRKSVLEGRCCGPVPSLVHATGHRAGLSTGTPYSPQPAARLASTTLKLAATCAARGGGGGALANLRARPAKPGLSRHAADRPPVPHEPHYPIFQLSELVAWCQPSFFLERHTLTGTHSA